MRLDAFLAGRLKSDSVTRARVQKWIDAGRVTLDGQATTRSGSRLKHGAVVEVDLPEPQALALLPEAIPLAVLYEDPDLIVVDKAAGMSTHPGAGHDRGTLVNALLAHCGPALTGIGDVLRPGIVHRLDMDTSGVMVVAKSELAHQSLSRQFHDHTVNRRYRALAWGNPGPGTIDARIARDPRNRKRFAVTGDPQAGKHAITHVVGAESLGEVSLLELQLETGRTHQIRVHLSSLGFPLVGDALYGGRRGGTAASRQMLHAFLLGFDHPRSGERLTFQTPFPADMETLLSSLRGEER